MKKAVLLASILAVAIAGHSFAADARRTVTKQVVRDGLIWGVFQTLDESGCILIGGYAAGERTVVRGDNPGNISTGETIVVAVDLTDICNAGPIIYGQGVGTPTKLVIDPVRGKGKLVGDVQVYESLQGQYLTIHVDLDFDASGPVQTNRDVTVTFQDGTKIVTIQRGKVAPAVATGKISSNCFPPYPCDDGGAIEFATGPSLDGTIQRTGDATITITKP